MDNFELRKTASAHMHSFGLDAYPECGSSRQLALLTTIAHIFRKKIVGDFSLASAQQLPSFAFGAFGQIPPVQAQEPWDWVPQRTVQQNLAGVPQHTA